MDEAVEPRNGRDAAVRWLESRGAGAMAIGLVLCVLVLGVFDYATGFEVSFAFFYVAPVVVAAWFVGERFAAALSVLSAVVWHFANVLAGEKFSQEWIYYWNAATRMGFFLLTSTLVARLRTSLNREKGLSRTDALTGLANGRALHEIASAEILRSSRYGHHLTIACLDLDDFKMINDTLGHGAGDLALRVVARELVRGTRRTDCAARLGGDEFVILLPETDGEVARAVVQRLQTALRAAMESNGWAIGFSIGMLTLRDPGESLAAVLERADAALYEAKRQGKNRIEHVVA